VTSWGEGVVLGAVLCDGGRDAWCQQLFTPVPCTGTSCNPNSRNVTDMNREGLSVKLKVTFTLGPPNSCYTPNPSFPPPFDHSHVIPSSSVSKWRGTFSFSSLLNEKSLYKCIFLTHDIGQKWPNCIVQSVCVYIQSGTGCRRADMCSRQWGLSGEQKGKWYTLNWVK